MSAKKQLISRRKFLTLTGASMATGLAAACAAPPSAPSAPQTEATTAPASEATQAPAPTEAPKAEGATELLYVYTNFVGIPKDQTLVEEALNKITAERINATMKLMNLDFGGFNDKVQLMSAGGEKYDLVYTANWTNDYYKNVDNGVFVELDELLKARAPKFYASMPEATWDAARVKRKIYAAINQQMFPKVGGFVIKKDIADKYQIDVAKINSWADLEPILEQLKQGENITPMANSNGIMQPEILNYVPVDDAVPNVGVKPESGAKVLNTFVDIPEFKSTWDLVKRWTDKGYVPKEPLKYDEEVAAVKAGKAVVKWEPVIKPKGEAEFTLRYGGPVVLRALAKPILNTAGITATLTGVSRTGNAEKSMDWLELVNTDKPTYNLLCFGIEGKHWDWDDKEKEVVKQIKDSGYDPTTDWMFGNQFNAYYREPGQVGAWDETKKLNDSATPSPALGFVVNREPIKNEIASVTAVAMEYSPTGAKAVDSSAFPKIVQDMDAAGFSRIIEEMQKQMDAWKAGK